MTKCPGAIPTITPGAAGRETRSTEERIREYFGPDETPALGAAISEAIMCLDPRYLSAIMEELGPGVRSEDAVVIWAIRRGECWRFASPR